ncbi:MAG: DUF1501 domain-containing protein [Pseudomonadota bacterium]
MTTRRDFLKNSALFTAASMVGAAGAPNFSFGQTAGGKTYIKVFMRGGADGLHLFPAVGDPLYYTYRPGIAIPAPNQSESESAIDIGQTYRAMNPNLAPLMEIWDAGRMMVSPATFFDGGGRSHFDNQRWIGNGARNNLIDGYLNRYLQELPGVNHPVRGAVLGKTGISGELKGALAVPAVGSANGFSLQSNDFCEGQGCQDNQLTEYMREVASHPVVESAVEGSVRENQLIMLDTIDEIKAAGADYMPSAGGMDYSGSPLGKGLRLVAQLLKAGVPLEVAAIDWNIGWDTHSNQISTSAQRFTDQEKGYHRKMREGSLDFVTFFRDMGALMDDVVVLVCTEFGRTVEENGSSGTDHGNAGAWFAFGGPTRPGLAADVSSLEERERNYLPMRVDYRDIVAEIMIRHMGMSENLVSTIFPNHTLTNQNLFSLNA